jgi:mevalonate kinase
VTDGDGGSVALEGIPARELPLSTRAPAKCILFGEHAVVHGRPELLLAVDLYTQIAARRAEAFSMNADPHPRENNPYFARALDLLWPEERPLALTVVSRIPRAAGLGSSAAFVGALAALLGAAHGGLGRAELHQRAFEIEQGAQGVGSPGDTAAVVGGGYLTVNGPPGAELWRVHDARQEWRVARVADPGWGWLVAYSGIPRNTGLTVRAVGERLARPDGPSLLERFERVALSGIEAVGREDRAEVGRLLEENHALLREVGVSHPRLEEVLSAVRPACEGAKVTGAGAGGSIVALPRAGRELEALRRATRAGTVAYLVRPAARGAEVVETPSAPPV